MANDWCQTQLHTPAGDELLVTVAAGVPVAGRVQQRPLLCPVYTRLSPLQLVTGPISHHRHAQT